MIELNRIAKEYKEIEQFADYELTQCVAYEMAIRNNDNLEKIEKLIEYYNEHKSQIFEINVDNYLGLSIQFKIIRELVEDIDFLSKDYVDKRITSNAYDIVMLMNEHEYSIYGDTVNGGPQQDKTKIIKRKDYSIKIQLTKYEEHIMVDSKDPQQTEEIIPEYYITNGIEIIENFKRPKLKMDRMRAINSKVQLDLNKPREELIAYIEYIKNDLDKNKNVLKAPIELFDEELQKADDISRMCTETKNGKEICFDGRKGITRTQKLADMFFIYDAVQQGAKELRIRMELSEYYETIGKKTDMSDKTFRKYRDIAIDYIENERYNELVTGVKS